MKSFISVKYKIYLHNLIYVYELRKVNSKSNKYFELN